MADKVMTKEELKSLANSKASEANEAKVNEETTLEDYEKILEELEEAVSKYNAQSKLDAYNSFLAKEKPLYEAIMAFEYDTIKAKEVKAEKDSTVATIVVEEGHKPIDIIDFNDFAEKRGPNSYIGESRGWVKGIEELNCLMTMRAVKSMTSINPRVVRDNYYMRKIQEKIDLGETDVYSNTKLLNALKNLIAMMIGREFKPCSKDVAYLLFVYGKDDKSKCGAAAANHRNFAKYIKKIARRTITHDSFEVLYKKNKEGK